MNKRIGNPWETIYEIQERLGEKIKKLPHVSPDHCIQNMQVLGFFIFENLLNEILEILFAALDSK